MKPAEKMPEIKRCPFCGSDDTEVRGLRAMYIRCNFCGAEGPPEDTDREAIEAWNMRVENGFIQAWHQVADSVHQIARRKGWWDAERNDGEIIALMHSELSEALEALRQAVLGVRHERQSSEAPRGLRDHEAVTVAYLCADEA